MNDILKYRSQIYGILTLWIVLFHIYRQLGFPFNCFVGNNILNYGNIGVDAFLFLSGYCLSLSFKRENNLINFYKKRFLRVLLPYLVISLPFFLWKSMVEIPNLSGGFNFLNFIKDITGYSFWISGCQNAWFLHAILLLYIVFPAFFYICSKGLKFAIALLFAFYSLIVILHFCSFAQASAVAWSRIPNFIIGIIASIYFSQIKFSKNASFASIILFILFFGIFPLEDLDFARPLSKWCLFALLVLPLLYVLKPIAKGKWLSYVGSLSFETYLVHVFLIHILVWYNQFVVIGYWWYILLPIVSITIASMFSKLSNKIIEWFQLKKTH